MIETAQNRDVYNSKREKHFRIDIRRRKRKKARRRKNHDFFISLKKELGGIVTYEGLMSKYLSNYLLYLIGQEASPFYLSRLNAIKIEATNEFLVPKVFSLVTSQKESLDFIATLFAALLRQTNKEVHIQYKNCERLDLDAQVLLDIIVKDSISFLNRCDHLSTIKELSRYKSKVNLIRGHCPKGGSVEKLLYSVGSPAINKIESRQYEDVIPYSLCVHRSLSDTIKQREQKDIDTTLLVEYVIKCLGKFNRELTPEKLDSLCTIIGEILINAEEHSTTNCRFSIGYFEESECADLHVGTLQLVIMNFGHSIYEKFSDPRCPNQEVVMKMKQLSERFTKRKMLQFKVFEEETLWTLYALQEGVTSVSPDRYDRRGNGSIQFIESFFELKGSKKVDNVSRLFIHSGHTTIDFDGTYGTQVVERDGERYKYMTFNKSGNIEERPDNRFVKYTDNYFPGTYISTSILFNDDDFKE